MLIRFIGDVHSQFGKYVKLTETCLNSIQVGDFGIGFGIDPPYLNGNHFFIRGNHDHPNICQDHPKFIKDGTFRDDIFFIGGAFSTDRLLRTEGLNWWPDEELSISELNEIVDRYIKVKPAIVVSHTCPLHAAPYSRESIPSRTVQALSAMFEIHKPKLWVFGHYHSAFDTVINGTSFVCVDMESYVDIDTSLYLFDE